MSDTQHNSMLPQLMSEPRPESVDTLCNRLRSVGLVLPRYLPIRCEQLTDGITLQQILTLQPDPSVLTRGWKAVLRNSTTSRDNIAQIATLGAFLIAFQNIDLGLESALARNGLGIHRSKSEAALRLFGREYDAVRKLLQDRFSRDSARSLIVEAVKIAGLVETSLHTNERTRRNYFGMRGVAKLILLRGRDSEGPVNEYWEVLHDLEEARHLGDLSQQHYEYEIETLLRIHKHSGSDDALTRAESLLKDCELTTRGLLYVATDTAVRRGLALVDAEALTEARASFSSAINFATRGLACHGRGTPDDVFYAKRGQAKQRLFSIRRMMDGIEDLALLDDAIEDAERVGPRSPIGISNLSACLLLRAMSAKKNGHQDEAISDLERAVASLPKDASGPEPQEIRANALGLLAELRLWKAISEGSPIDVEFELGYLLQLSSEVSPSISPLGPAVDILVNSLGVEKCAGLIRRAAFFIEQSMQTTHRDGSARRFAASHAGNILLQLRDPISGTNGEDHSDDAIAGLQDLEHAWGLLREAVESSPDAVQPELWGKRDEAALRLAKRALREGFNDDDVRLIFEDACESLVASLQAADRAASGFRLTKGYSKLGEAYVRLHSITGKNEQADCAISALSQARALGNSAPQLLGLLADAHYRRGRANGSLTDLRLALQLKAQARDAGHNSRENWSVSAAAALRIWQLSRQPEDLRAAIEAICASNHIDPKWPWPPLQMADVARLPQKTLCDAAGDLQNKFARLACAGKVDSLEAIGANLAYPFRGRDAHRSNPPLIA